MGTDLPTILVLLSKAMAGIPPLAVAEDFTSEQKEKYLSFFEVNMLTLHAIVKKEGIPTREPGQPSSKPVRVKFFLNRVLLTLMHQFKHELVNVLPAERLKLIIFQFCEEFKKRVALIHPNKSNTDCWVYQTSDEFTKWFVEGYLSKAEMTALRKEASSKAPAARNSTPTKCVDALPEWIVRPEEVSESQELCKFCPTRSVQEYRLPELTSLGHISSKECGMVYLSSDTSTTGD
jgi:hypothetical protein